MLRERRKAQKALATEAATRRAAELSLPYKGLGDELMPLYIENCWRGGHEGRPGYWMTFKAFQPGFTDGIEQLKGAVPARERSYDEAEHRWWIAAEWAQTITVFVHGLDAHLRQRALF